VGRRAAVGTGTAAASPKAAAQTTATDVPLPARTTRRADGSAEAARTIAQASTAAKASTANATRGAPPQAASGSNGPLSCPNASRAQGNPPNGQRSRTHSTASQITGSASGHHARRPTRVNAAPSTANHTASISATTSQASTPMPRRKLIIGTR